MVSAIAGAIIKELLLLSRKLTQWKSCDVMILCELADKLECQDAIDSCSKYFVSQAYGGKIRDSINKADICFKTKDKIRGLKMEELTKKIRTSFTYENKSGKYVVTNWYECEMRMDQLGSIAKDLISE